MQRVMVVFNKWWEFEPGFASLLSDYARPYQIKDWWPTFNEHPRPRRNPDSEGTPKPAAPRAVFTRDGWGRVEAWCISDLLEHLPDKGKWQSSSERKAERLLEMFQGDPPSLVIAVGTASAGESSSINGSVVVGTKCFLHNSHPNGENHDSNWQFDHFDLLLESSLSKEKFTDLLGPTQIELAKRFLPTPINGAPAPRVLADYNAVALGNMNVSDYREYDLKDAETLTYFRKLYPFELLGSLETTHGLIRALGSSNFIFISGIVDRLGHFHEDVDPRPYAQNTAGAHNAGVTVAWLLSRLRDIL